MASDKSNCPFPCRVPNSAAVRHPVNAGTPCTLLPWCKWPRAPVAAKSAPFQQHLRLSQAARGAPCQTWMRSSCCAAWARRFGAGSSPLLRSQSAAASQHNKSAAASQHSTRLLLLPSLPWNTRDQTPLLLTQHRTPFFSGCCCRRCPRRTACAASASGRSRTRRLRCDALLPCRCAAASAASHAACASSRACCPVAVWHSKIPALPLPSK